MADPEREPRRRRVFVAVVAVLALLVVIVLIAEVRDRAVMRGREAEQERLRQRP